ncbi:MAG: hypothetical protein AAGI10_11505 [Pseudomonadota bacterium]
MGTKYLEITLFGACVIRGLGADVFEVSGAKHKGLFAILATAPNGRATRTHLQQMLWGASSYDGGQQSLRRALSDIKRVIGDTVYEEVISATNAEITLDMSKVTLAGQPGRGTFLEGLDIKAAPFESWRDQIRANPDQIFALYGPTHASPNQAVVPAISILPFRVVFGDQQHSVLGDFLAEQICRSMSRSRLVAVISHMSARTLASTSVALDDIRRKLAVDYCLTGSIRVAGERILLDVDFLDARSGRILWTRAFNETMAEYISGESAAEYEIVSAIGHAIASDAIKHTQKRRLKDIEDHHLLVAGVGLMNQLRFSSFVESREMIKEAIQRAPRTSEAYAWLADWHIKSVYNGWSTDRAADARKARDATARALDIDPDNSFSLTMDGTVLNTLVQDPDEAGRRFDHALSLNPNESLCYLQKGVLHAFQDQADRAVMSVEKANKLSPIDPFGYFYDSLTATAYLASEDWENALKFTDRSLLRNERHTSTLRTKLTAQYYLGRMDEARSTFEQLIRREPDFNVEHYIKMHPAAGNKVGRHVIKALEALSQ